MCYNYAIEIPAKELEKEFNRKMAEDDGKDYEKYYNSDGFRHPKMPVISNDEPDAIKLSRWGLVPSWAKTDEQALKMRKATLNAKAETIFGLPSFWQVAPFKRCLILATGFFEPHHEANGQVTYYYIHFKQRKTFAFGGIWNKWKSPSGEVQHTYSMITTEPSPFMAKIHNAKPRMPLILSERNYGAWLSDDLAKEDMKRLMQPYGDVNIEAWPVSKLINNRRNLSNVPEVKQRAGPPLNK